MHSNYQPHLKCSKDPQSYYCPTPWHCEIYQHLLGRPTYFILKLHLIYCPLSATTLICHHSSQGSCLPLRLHHFPTVYIFKRWISFCCFPVHLSDLHKSFLLYFVLSDIFNGSWFSIIHTFHSKSALFLIIQKDVK